MVQLAEAWDTLLSTEVAEAAWVPLPAAAAAARGEPSPFAPFMPIDASPGAYRGFWEALGARFDEAGAPPRVDDVSRGGASTGDLRARVAAYAPVPIAADLASLPPRERVALRHAVAAARAVSTAYGEQLWAGVGPLLGELDATAAAAPGDEHAALLARYARINGGPWSALGGGAAFVGAGPVVAVPQRDGTAVRVVLPVPRRQPPSGAFYPPGASAAEVRAWLEGLPAGPARAAAGGYFTRVVRRADGGLDAVPYSEAHAGPLRDAAGHLRALAAATTDGPLAAFAASRAGALESNEYAASDADWLALGARDEAGGGPPRLDLTIGPYETYADGLMGLKATFEA